MQQRICKFFYFFILKINSVYKVHERTRTSASRHTHSGGYRRVNSQVTTNCIRLVPAIGAFVVSDVARMQRQRRA